MKFIKIPGQDFEMMDAPVTQKEWVKVMKTKLFHFKNKPNNPAENISWEDVNAFIKELNKTDKKYSYRLPTEQEWELCAKSCDDQPIEKIAWSWENSKGAIQPVRKKKPNKLGLYDMLGNVWEWTDSLWSDTGSNRVIRGGSWGSDARYLRSAYRGGYSPGNRSTNLGFRLVRTPVTLGHLKVLPLDKAEIARGIAKVQATLKKLEELIK